jgi:Protein of unknown function (DUF2793)
LIVLPVLLRLNFGMTTLTQRYPAGYQFFSDTGAPLALGTLTFYQAGTTNYGATFQNSDGTGANGDVITLNSAGRLDVNIYLGAAYHYKEVLKAASGTQIYSTDNIPPTAAAPATVTFAGAIWPVATKTAASVLTTDDLLGRWIEGAIVAGGTLTLPSAVTAGSGYGGIIAKSIAAGTLTIATQSAQTINGAATLTLTSQYDAYLFISDGANWRAFEWIGGNTITADKLAGAIISGMTAATSFDRTADYFAIHSAGASAPRKLLGKLAERYPDAMPSWRVINQITATPPGSPSEGDAYVVYTSGTGAWSGWDGSIAHYFNGAWKRETPAAGWWIWDIAQSAAYTYTGTAWAPGIGLTAATIFTTPKGGALKFGFFEEEITLTGASTDSTNVLPNQSLVFGVSSRVTQTITSAAGTAWTIGPASGGGAGDWGSSLPFTLGTTNQGVSVQNHYGEKVRITCTGGTFTGGKVRVSAFYAQITPATS